MAKQGLRSPRRKVLIAALALLGALVGTMGTVASAGEPVPSSPVKVYALGDSISNAWGAPGGGDAATHPEKSWTTGTDAGTGSWVQRIKERLPALATVDGVNLAAAGSKVTSGNGVLTQAGSVGADASVVLIGVGSADLCLNTVLTPGDLTDPTVFRQQIDSTLSTIVSHAPTAKIFISSIPNWYNLWENVPVKSERFNASRGWTCPLLFKSSVPAEADDANATTRAAFRSHLIDYNAALQAACAAVATCRFDGNAVYDLPQTEADVSTTDYFHPSISGQQRLAQTTWRAGWFALTDAVPGFTATPGVGSVTLAWGALPASASGIVIRQKVGSAPTGPTDGTAVTPGTGTATITGLSPGTTYHYGAFAVDVDGDSGPGAFASATPTAPPPTTTTTTTTTPATTTTTTTSGGSTTQGADVTVAESAPLPNLAVALSRSGSGTLHVGDTATLVARVSAGNQVAAHDVVLTVQLPDGLRLGSAQVDRGQGCTGDRQVSCKLDLAAGNATATLAVVVERSDSLVANASVASLERDADSADNRGSLTVTALPAPDPNARVLAGKTGSAISLLLSHSVATIVTRVAVNAADTLEISVLPAGSRSRLPLLARTNVGGAITGYWRKTFVYHMDPAAGDDAQVDMRLRVSEALLEHGKPYLVRVVVRGAATQASKTVSIRFTP